MSWPPEEPTPPQTVDEYIEICARRGMLINNLSQMADGKWRLSLRAFPATPEIARDPEYSDYYDHENPLVCFVEVLASRKYPAFIKQARDAVEAMRSGTAQAYLKPWGNPNAERDRKRAERMSLL